jgi:hypothetical protein
MSFPVISTACILSLAVSTASGATSYCTASATADPTVADSFTPAGLPRLGDAVEILDGHTLTNPPGHMLEIGDPGAHGICLRSSGTKGTGRLVNKGTLTVHGDIHQGAATWELFGGSVVEMARDDSHGQPNVWQIGDANQTATASLVRGVDDTPRNPVTIRGSAAGTANGYLTAGKNLGCGLVDFNALVLEDLGSADGNNPAILTWSTYVGNTFSIAWLQARRCGMVVHAPMNVPAGNTFRIRNATIRDSITPASVPAIRCDGGSGSGTREFHRIRSDRGLRLLVADADVYDVVIAAPSSSTAWIPFIFGGAPIKRLERVLTVRRVSGGSGWFEWKSPWGTPISDVYVIDVDAPNSHPFGYGTNSATTAAVTTEDRVLTQMFSHGQDGCGDPRIMGNPSIPHTVRFRNSIALHDGDDRTKQSSKFFSPLGNGTNLDVDVEHCTWVTTGLLESGLNCGETQAVNVGQLFASVRSNIAYNPSPSNAGNPASNTGVVISRRDYFAQPDLVLAEAVSHNATPGCHNWDKNGRGYWGTATGGLVDWLLSSHAKLDATDIHDEPQFFDPRLRDIAVWYADLSKSTWEQAKAREYLDAAITELMKANDISGFDPRFEIAGADTALVEWVVAGWAPTAPAYDPKGPGAAHDAAAPTTPAGGTRGAVAWRSVPTDASEGRPGAR